MQARMLLLAGVLSVCGCSKPQVSPEESTIETPAPAPRRASKGTVYLLRRVAVATEDSLHGFEEGTEAKVIQERPEKLLIEVQGWHFEINHQDATNDLDLRDRILSRAAEREAARLTAMATPTQTEDQRFLAEENARRRSSTETQIAHLRRMIESARAEIARLEAEYNESLSGWNEEHTTTTDDSGSLYPNGVSADSTENMARQERIAVLQTQIANYDRQIQMLSDAVAGGN